MHRLLFGIFLILCAVVSREASAALRAPVYVIHKDSLSAVGEKGVEYYRATENFSYSPKLSEKIFLQSYGRWKTDWQRPTGETDRVRQDGRWYLAGLRKLHEKIDGWAGGEGEHFDDRPQGNSPSTQGANSVRILRGGGGFTVRPLDILKADLAAGIVEDRRIGRVESGLGIWTNAKLEKWILSGYEQTLTAEFNRESPQKHRNTDLNGRYELFRKFSEGNSNYLEATGSLIDRDVFRDALSRLSKRKEKFFGVRDNLDYTFSEFAAAQFGGEISHKSTDLGESDTESSDRLEENQTGFSAAMQLRKGQTSGLLELALRSVSQNIRGDILQGSKADLSLGGQLKLSKDSRLSLKTGVSKYKLDTRNENNFDDRDELRYSTEAIFQKPLFKTLMFEAHSVVQLDHLVYIYKQRSANNRWTRFFLLGSRMTHRPTGIFAQSILTEVSSNYQDYDFELDARVPRSTVFRRFLVSDSIGYKFAEDFLLSNHVSVQFDEFGRLFWDEFEEQRSDQTHSLYFASQIIWSLGGDFRAGAGGLWDSRRGKRFPDQSVLTSTIFQDIKSYGPTFMFEKLSRQGWFVNLRGRAIRQSQLNLDDRWIVSGDVTGGVRW